MLMFLRHSVTSVLWAYISSTWEICHIWASIWQIIMSCSQLGSPSASLCHTWASIWQIIISCGQLGSPSASLSYVVEIKRLVIDSSLDGLCSWLVVTFPGSTCDGGTAKTGTIDPTIPTTPCPIFITGGNTNASYCYFPFITNGITFTECTQQFSWSNIFWCSVTYDYDADRLWGYCAGQSNLFNSFIYIYTFNG